MSTLLILDTSPRGDAVSRQLTDQFMQAWNQQNP
jgi:FMN-dependent NADH-azoreductase